MVNKQISLVGDNPWYFFLAVCYLLCFNTLTANYFAAQFCQMILDQKACIHLSVNKKAVDIDSLFLFGFFNPAQNI